jgi:hypothetical protein
LAKALIAELDDESQIEEIKRALSKADKSTFLTVAVFFALGISFLIMKN